MPHHDDEQPEASHNATPTLQGERSQATPPAALSAATSARTARRRPRFVRPVTDHAAAYARRHTPTPWTRADWLVAVVIGALAGITRFVALTSITDNGTPVFDEKHYVPQAFDITESATNPLIGGIELNPGYGLVVHPPLAKQLYALSESVFGYTPLGWRLVPALLGVVTVLAIVWIARRLSHSTTVAAIAGGLAICDGMLLIASRYGLLDIVQTVCVLLAAGMLIVDHQGVVQRSAAALRSPDAAALGMHSQYGPRYGFRWWRFGAGIMLGLAVSVKWSGLYFIAFFGVLAVAVDAYRRHRFGARSPIRGALFRDVPAAFASLVIVPLGIYLWSWRAWFAQETSVFRHAATDGSITDDSLLSHLPNALASFLYYHLEVLHFHETLTTSGGHVHPWDSKPWSWLAATRPILYFSSRDLECGQHTCDRVVYLFGTPAIWWLTVPVLFWALWSLVVRRQHAYLVPLVAFAAGFLPWLATYDRQMYFFYAAPLVPFTILMLALACGEVLYGKAAFLHANQAASAPAPTRPKLRKRLVIGYLVVVVGMFAYFSPLLYGYAVPQGWLDSMLWLPSWR